MEFKELKPIFLQEAELYYKNLRREFLVDENNRRIFEMLCLYFSKDKDFEEKFGGQLQKGIMLFGNVGSGKTSTFQIFQNISKKHNLKSLWFPMISTTEVVTKFNSSTNKDDIINYYSFGKYMFDDLGREKMASNFGKEDIFSRIMDSRYREFIEKNTRTFLTTNYSLEEISKRYGDHIYDRFSEMFNIIEMSGKTRRF